MSDNPVVVIPPSTPSVVVVPSSTAAVVPSTVNVSGTSVGPQGVQGEPGIIATSTAPAPGSTVYWADTTEPGYEAVPPGGLSSQVLKKNSDADYDFGWSNLGSGTVTSITATSPLTGGTITSSGSIGIQDASTTQKGAVQLEDSVNSTSTTKSATPNSVKTAYDLASTASTAAGTAQATANSAVTLANTAQATANSAVTAAGNAQSTANSKIASVSAGAGMTATTVSGAVTVTNAGVTSFNSTTGSVTLTSGTGIVVTNVSGTTTVTNDGVTSLNAGTGVSVSATKGGVTLTNTGILSVGAGTGLTSTTVSGAVTLTNAGLLSLAGVTGSATVATSKGAVVTTSGSQITFSNTQDIQTSATPQFSKLGIGAAAVGGTTAVNISGGRLALGVSSTNYASINIPVSTTVPTSGSYVIGDLWVGGSPATLAFATDINIAKAVAWADFSNATGVLGVANGGTGKSTWATNSIAVFNGTTATAVANVATSGLPLLSSASGLSVPSFSTLDISLSNVTVSGNLSVGNGGTGASSAALALTNLGGASLTASNAFTVGGHTITNAVGSDVIGLVVKGSAAQSAANIFEVQSTNATILSVTPGSRVVMGGNVGSKLDISTSGNIGLGIKSAFTTQKSDFIQLQNSAGTILGGQNAAAQIYTGTTDSFYAASVAVGTSPNPTSVDVPTTSSVRLNFAVSHNLTAGGLVKVAGVGANISGAGVDGTYMITATTATSLTYAYPTATLTVAVPATVTGSLANITIQAPSQATITSRDAGTAALTIQGASGQQVNLVNIRSSTSTVASIDIGGGARFASVANLAGFTNASATFANSGTIIAAGSSTSDKLTSVVLKVQNSSSQNPTADLFQALSTSGAVLTAITAGGALKTGTFTSNTNASAGHLLLGNTSTTPTAQAGNGVLWANNGALTYLGTSGTTGQQIIGSDGSGALIFNRTTSDSAAITATTLQNMFSPGTLTLEPSTSYAFRLVGAVNRGTATASTLSVRLTMSSTPTTYRGSVYTLSPTAGSTALHTTNITSTESQIDVSAASGTATTTLRFFYEGFITTSATGGTLIPQFIQSANASSVIQAGTYIQLIKVGTSAGAWA